MTGPGLVGDLLIVQGDQGVVALKTADGTTAWTQPQAQPGNLNVTADSVFGTTAEGEIMRINAVDGAIAWTAKMTNGSGDVVAVVGDTAALTDNWVVASGTNSGLYGLDAHTGAIKWQLTGVVQPPSFCARRPLRGCCRARCVAAGRRLARSSSCGAPQRSCGPTAADRLPDDRARGAQVRWPVTGSSVALPTATNGQVSAGRTRNTIM
ncbi:PQQ-binding-like beta-propeller repeat protein [Actinoplanes sp. NPDC051513]|uniref:outer membrane protein assembly factor BamB family protein n=1 Tax=Actinoplanes sp. NPDC051513 TaxID=3363908 RepID=UPI0037965A06